MNTPVKFELAKLLKDKGYDKVDKENLQFYTKPNSKMFGIDKHGRTYPIKNTPKKLYIVKQHATLNPQNVYIAPTIAEVVMWLYEKHGIWIVVNVNIIGSWYFEHFDLKEKRNAQFKPTDTHYDSPTEAYEAAIEYVLTNLI